MLPKIPSKTLQYNSAIHPQNMLKKTLTGASVVRTSSHWHLPTARRYATRHSGRYRHHCTASRYYSLVAFSVAAAANTTVAGLRNQANWLKDAYSCFPVFRPTMLSEAPSIGSFSFPWSWLEASLCSIWSWVCWAGKFVWSLSQPWGRLCPPTLSPQPPLIPIDIPSRDPPPPLSQGVCWNSIQIWFVFSVF